MFRKNQYIQLAYKNYLDELLINKNKLKSIALIPREIKALEQPKYDLTHFEIYLFIKSFDYLWYHGEYTISLNEGITEDKNKFRNVLVDLLYHNINEEEIFTLPVSCLFGFQYYNGKPQNIDITRSTNIKKINKSVRKDKDSLIENFYLIKTTYKSYFGNYETYATLKLLIKLYLNEINLYYYNGKVYNELQLPKAYDISNSYYKKYSNWWLISKHDPTLIRLKYSTTLVEDPKDVSTDSLSDINITLQLQDLDFYNINDSAVTQEVVKFTLKDFWPTTGM